MWAYLEPSQILHLTRCQMSERKMRDISTEPGCISAGMVASARDSFGCLLQKRVPSASPQMKQHSGKSNISAEGKTITEKCFFFSKFAHHQHRLCKQSTSQFPMKSKGSHHIKNQSKERARRILQLISNSSQGSLSDGDLNFAVSDALQKQRAETIGCKNMLSLLFERYKYCTTNNCDSINFIIFNLVVSPFSMLIISIFISWCIFLPRDTCCSCVSIPFLNY